MPGTLYNNLEERGDVVRVRTRNRAFALCFVGSSDSTLDGVLLNLVQTMHCMRARMLYKQSARARVFGGRRPVRLRRRLMRAHHEIVGYTRKKKQDEEKKSATPRRNVIGCAGIRVSCNIYSHQL